MNVKFITTTSSKLDNLSVVDGQLIALSDVAGLYYDMEGVRRSISGGTYVHPRYTATPGTPTSDQTPGFGGAFTVNQVNCDDLGHLTSLTNRTITIPSTLSNGTGTAGLIKTSSTVTSSSGYTACPVINGVPYYKDTTYSLSSFGITSTAAELNYCDGVTSNIQTQLNGKAASHSHPYVPTAGGTMTGGLVMKAATPYIDFNFGNAASYTTRIQSAASGVLSIGGTGKGSVRVDSTNGVFSPATTGAYSLGTTDLRFHKIYLRTSPDVSSLVELKTQITKFSRGLDEIRNTDVYTYKYKDVIEDEGDDVIHVGFVIGQDYKCSPYLLAESKEGIDLYSAISVAISAVKELDELVSSLQKTIQEQQNIIDEMKSKLEETHM